jgi:hypothetical protein
MLSTMGNYKSAKDALESLTEGTIEYTEKLNEANEEALKLIELLDLTKGAGYDLEGNKIIINEDSKEYKTQTKNLENEMTSAYTAKIIG